MIPKRISFTWSGRKMSWMRYLTLYSFRMLNQDYEMYLYLMPEKKLNTLTKESSRQECSHDVQGNYFDEALRMNLKIVEIDRPPNLEPAHVHDYNRWKILATEGGYYSDMDILFLKPMSFLKVERQHTDAVVNYYKWLSIGFLGASPGNQYNLDIYGLCQRRIVETLRYQSYGVDVLYYLLSGGKMIDYSNKINWLKAMQQKYPKLQFMNLKNNWLYKYSYQQIHELFCTPNVVGNDPEMFACHWFGGTQVAQGFNSWATEKNFVDAGQTAIVSILKQVLSK